MSAVHGRDKLKEEYTNTVPPIHREERNRRNCQSRAPRICHLPGLDRYSTFFPTMTLHFVTIIAIIRGEKSISATPHNGPGIYIHSACVLNRRISVHIYKHAQT